MCTSPRRLGNILGINGPQVVLRTSPGSRGIPWGTFRTTLQGYPPIWCDATSSPQKSNVTYIPPDSPSAWCRVTRSPSSARSRADRSGRGVCGQSLVAPAVVRRLQPGPALVAGQSTSYEDRRPYPGFTNITGGRPAGMGHYHACQVPWNATVKRRVPDELLRLRKVHRQLGTALVNFNGNGRGSPQNFSTCARKGGQRFRQTSQHHHPDRGGAVGKGQVRRGSSAGRTHSGGEGSTINTCGAALAQPDYSRSPVGGLNRVSDYRGGSATVPM